MTESDVSGRRPLSTRAKWILGIVLALGLVLRLRGLTSFPLEGDEIYTFLEARDLFATELQPGIEARPLHYLLQHALFWLGPDRHPAMLRTLPLVFGLAGVWATWRLAREVADSVAGAAAGLLVVVSPWHLYVSGMARYWSLVYLLAVLFFWRLLVASRTRERRDYLLALAPCVAGILAHPTFMFPVAGCAVAVHIRPSRGGWKWQWPSRSALTGLWLPLLGIVLAEFAVLRLTGNSGAVRNWGGRPLAAVLRLLPAMVQWASPVVVAAGLLGVIVPLFDTAAKPTERRWGLIACLGLLSTVGLLLSAAAVTDVYADYGVSALPLVLVSAGVLVARGSRMAQSRTWAAAGVGLTVLLAGAAPGTVSHLSDGTRFDYRPALERVEETGPELPVYIDQIVQVRWYAPDLKGRHLRIRSPWRPPELPDRGAWIAVGVRRYGIPGDPSGRLRRWLSRRCHLEDARERPRFDYRTYRVELHRCRGRPEHPVAATRQPIPEPSPSGG